MCHAGGHLGSLKDAGQAVGQGASGIWKKHFGHTAIATFICQSFALYGSMPPRSSLLDLVAWMRDFNNRCLGSGAIQGKFGEPNSKDERESTGAVLDV